MSDQKQRLKLKRSTAKLWFVISASICAVWVLLGVVLFSQSTNDNFWTLGELGDYFGGGLGGLAILAILYTARIQAEQLEMQREQLALQHRDLMEAGVLRGFEVFKPELEGLSMRIVSKMSQSGHIRLGQGEFNGMAEKFHAGDKTVFLRAIKKCLRNDASVNLSVDHGELDLALKRFYAICSQLEASLEDIDDETINDGFAEAVRSTEIFECYKVLKATRTA